MENEVVILRQRAETATESEPTNIRVCPDCNGRIGSASDDICQLCEGTGKVFVFACKR